MSTEDPTKPKAGAKAVWLDPKTPQNFTAGCKFTEARLIGLRASYISRQRTELPKTSIPVARQNFSNTFAVLRHAQAVDEESFRNRRKYQKSKNDLSRRTLGPETLLRNGGSDPFKSTPVHLTAQNYHVLNTAKIVTCSTIFPTEINSRSGRYVYDEGFKRFVHEYFTDEAGSYVAMCLSWTIMSRLNPSERSKCLTHSFRHSAKAMEALKSTIARLNQDGVELEKVLRVVHLHCAAALWLGDRSAVMYHQDAVRRLIGLIGGLRQLEPLHQCFTAFLIVRIALITRTRTVLESAEWDPDRLPGIEEDTNPAATPSTESALAGPWRRVFVKLKEMARVERLAEQEVDYLRWCHLRRQAIKARVANMWCDFADPTRATDPVPGMAAVPTSVHSSSLDMCLCLAVQNYIVVTSEPSTMAQQLSSMPTRVFDIMLIRCLAKLEVDLEQLQRNEPRARDLLWVLGVGAIVQIQTSSQSKKPIPWADCDVEELASSQFMLHFGVLALSLGYKKYEDVEELFEKEYVYSPSVQEQILRCSFQFAVGMDARLFGSLWTLTKSPASA